MVDNVVDYDDVIVNGKIEEPRTIKISDDAQAADFETAITATGFGKFNVIIMLVILPTAFAQVFETSSMSYVLPIAQCDLNLTLEDKGLLNAITFAGMISSGFIWGYICDAYGRKKVMIIGYLLDGFFMIMAACSVNMTMLLVAKFFGGFLINGPFSAATSYLTEFHSSKNRARVQLVRGIIVTTGNIVMPLLSWAVLPRDLDFKLFNYIGFHSWNILLFICSLAPLTSGVLFVFMPESPKYLMSAGRNEQALKVFRRIYAINTGKPADAYPIKTLVEETVPFESNKSNGKTSKQNLKMAVMEGLYKIKPLFCPPHILRLVHVCANTFLILMSANTLKLWLPQLFQSINDYQHGHGGASSSICVMLESTLSGKNVSTSTCDVNLDNSSVYINSIIAGCACILCFFLAGTVINFIGKKNMIVAMTVIGGACASCIYFSQNAETVLALSAIFLSLVGVGINVLVTITLEIFPTNLRAMALSLHLMSSRIGTIVGNMVFPFLLRTGCAPPFLYIGFLSFGTALLTMIYPNTENKPLT